MKGIKRNSSLNFPIKLNYKSNDLIYSYRGGNSTSNLKLINVNKNKFFEENKSFTSCDRNMKSNLNITDSKMKRNKNKKNDIISPLTNNSYKNVNNSLLGIYTNDKKEYLNNYNFYSYKSKINDSYNSDYYRDVSKISNNNSKYNISTTISNINTNNNINNFILPYNKTNNIDKNLFNKKQVYQKPKNERRTLSSYSFAITDCNTSNKENISIKSNINTETDYNNYNPVNKNLNQYNYKNIIGTQRNTEIIGNSTYLEKKINNYLNFKEKYNNKSLMDERRTNIDYSNLNLYCPNKLEDIKENKIYYIKKDRQSLKSDIIKNDICDTISYFNDKNYNIGNDNSNINSYIYVRKNNSKKNIMNKSSSFKINNNINYSNKIRVNLKSNNIIENAYYVQKNVILIQKNYRMHLACLKKHILKAIKKIIEGINKLYYIFYKNYAKKFIYILNNAYIKSININMRTSRIIPKIRNRHISNENEKNNFNKKIKNSYLNSKSERNKKFVFKENKKLNVIYSKKQNNEIKQNYKITNLNQIQKDIEHIRNLKNQILNKLNLLKK